MSWNTKRGEVKANYFGSFTQSASAHVGTDSMKNILPMVDPNDILVGGWDISNKNLYESCKRAQVLDHDLIEKLKPHLEEITPLPAVLNPEFIAANQEDRTNNLIVGGSQAAIDQIREDIKYMKSRVDKVIVLWSANTEMFLRPEIETKEQLEKMKAAGTLPAS